MVARPRSGISFANCWHCRRYVVNTRVSVQITLAFDDRRSSLLLSPARRRPKKIQMNSRRTPPLQVGSERPLDPSNSISRARIGGSFHLPPAPQLLLPAHCAGAGARVQLIPALDGSPRWQPCGKLPHVLRESYRALRDTAHMSLPEPLQ